MRSLFVLLAGCTQIDVAAILPVSDEDGGVPVGLDAKPGGGICDGPVVLGDVCGSSLAERVFRFALCSCDDSDISAQLTTDSFDSRLGPWVTGGRAGSVGMNRHADFGGRTVIDGSLWVGNIGGFQAGVAGAIEIAGELRSNGPLLSDSSVRVEHDAWVNGMIDVVDLYVGGVLRTKPNEPITVSGMRYVMQTSTATFTVDAPCDCASDRMIDVASIVSRHAADNDNASIGLDPGALGNVERVARLELPCGRFYLDRIGGAGDVAISVLGRAALFVGGDLSLGSALTVEVAPEGELDLFVAGAIVSAQRISIGSPQRPSRARVYFGTSGTLQLSGGALLAANVYAPKAELVASAPIEVLGALFVNRVNSSADITVHYDTSVLDAAADCPLETETGCAACPDCTNSACHPTTSACCAPLACVEGACSPSL